MDNHSFEIFERRRRDHIWLTRKHRLENSAIHRDQRRKSSGSLSDPVARLALLYRCTIPHESHENCTCRNCTLLCTLEILPPCTRHMEKLFMVSFNFNGVIIFAFSSQSLIRLPSKSRSQARKFQISMTKVPELFALVIKIAITEQLIDYSTLLNPLIILHLWSSM